MIVKEIDELVAEWKDRLHLNDWNIVIRDNVSSSEMDGCRGSTEYAESNKEAVIWLLDPEQFPDFHFVYDKEKTLVHELLHLKMSLLDDTENQTQNRIVHQLIDEFAGAFVDAKRARDEKEKTVTEENEEKTEDSNGDDHDSAAAHAHFGLMSSRPKDYWADN